MGPITGVEDTWKLMVPAEHRAQILTNAHRDITSGYLGVEKGVPTKQRPIQIRSSLSGPLYSLGRVTSLTSSDWEERGSGA